MPFGYYSWPRQKDSSEVATAIYDQKGKGTCILLDGLDEASVSLLDTLLDMIIGRQRKHTPQISFIMTTRPNMHIASCLQPVLKFKVMLEGFSTAHLYEFLKHALDYKHTPHYLTLLDKFKANPQLECICAHITLCSSHTIISALGYGGNVHRTTKKSFDSGREYL